MSTACSEAKRRYHREWMRNRRNNPLYRLRELRAQKLNNLFNRAGPIARVAKDPFKVKCFWCPRRAGLQKVKRSFILEDQYVEREVYWCGHC
jgi:hypothetical protein